MDAADLITIVLWPFAVGFVALGFYLLYLSRHEIKIGYSSYWWPPTIATITARVNDSFSTVGLVSNTGIGKVRYTEWRHVYKYKVDGRHFTGNVYCLGSHAGKSDVLIPIGDHVKGYYNPRDPRIAMLKKGVAMGSIVGISPLIGGILWVVSLVMSFLEGE